MLISSAKWLGFNLSAINSAISLEAIWAFSDTLNCFSKTFTCLKFADKDFWK